MIKPLRFILMPLLLWTAKRRSKRDNVFTLKQLEDFKTKTKSTQ